MRVGEVETWEQQGSGEVGQQTEHLKPSPGNPEEGLPANPTGSENTGGANPSETTEPSTRSTWAEAAKRIADFKARGTAEQGSSNGEATLDPVAEAKEQLLRLTADFENYKRQAARRETEARERAVRGVLTDLLPVLDNFERAVDAAKNAKDIESLRIGVEYILKQLQDTLQSLGVETIPAKGQKFDLTKHEATEEVASEEHPAGTVIDETQRGYMFRGQVIRPSRVRVSSGQ
jgi:molecular chaperone GrpE